jgi:quinol monooxygenase YgiN
MVVLTATWRAKPGNEQRCAEILELMTPLTRAEPGCLFYQAHRSADDPRVFVLYEQYVDDAALLAHSQSEHFKAHVLGEAVPLLESRFRTFLEPVG